MENAKETLKTLKRIEAEMLKWAGAPELTQAEQYGAMLAWKAVYEEIEEFKAQREEDVL